MAKHIPQRMCLCCRQSFDKDSLIRIVKSGDKIFVDKSFKASGRGAYVCKNAECLNKLVKTKQLNKAFKMMVDDEIYASILKEVELEK